MATRFQLALQPTIQEAIDTFDIPGFAIVAMRSGHPVEYLFVGTDAAGTPLNDDSIFPNGFSSAVRSLGQQFLRHYANELEGRCAAACIRAAQHAHPADAAAGASRSGGF